MNIILNKVTILIICLIAFSTAIVMAATPPSYFTDNMAATGTSPDVTPMEQALVDLINGATTSIDAAYYDFNRDRIRDALIAAHGRGVTVQVITDDEARFHIASYIPYYAALETAGITVKDDEREDSIMHNKYFIIDGQTVWTGSTNMTDNGFTKNHNNSIVFTSPDVVAIYQNDFNQMWAGNFSVNKTASMTTTTTFDGKSLEIYFSPKDDAVDEVIAEVNAAQISIDFAIFFFTSDDLANALTGALVQARSRGVQIRGIWDNLGAANAFSDDEKLCDAGIPIKTEDTIGKMHNKLMIIDANGSTPRIVTGSMNWSSSGDTKNDENTVIYHDLVTAQAFATNFQTMWDALDASTQCEITLPDTKFIYLPTILRTGIPTAIADVKISSILYNPPGSDAEGENVMLKNLGSVAQDMTDWTLRDEVDTIFTFPSFTLNPGATVTIWVRSGTNTTIDLYWNRDAATWNNGGDIATLKNSNGDIVDSCTYEGGETETNCN